MLQTLLIVCCLSSWMTWHFLHIVISLTLRWATWMFRILNSSLATFEVCVLLMHSSQKTFLSTLPVITDCWSLRKHVIQTLSPLRSAISLGYTHLNISCIKVQHSLPAVRSSAQLHYIQLRVAYSKPGNCGCHLEVSSLSSHPMFNPYPTAFPYGNGMVLHFYQQQESSTTKTVHKVINKGLKANV